MTTLTAVLMFIVPGAIAGSVMLAIGLLSPRSDAEGPPRASALRRAISSCAPPAMFAAALWVADFGLNNIHPLWNKDGTKRYVAVAIGAAILGAAHASTRPWGFGLAARSIAGAATCAAVLSPLAGGEYMPHSLYVPLLIASALWLPMAGSAADLATRRGPSFAAPAGLALAAAAAAPGIFESSYASGALYAGTLSAIASGAAVAALILRRRSGPIARGLHTAWLAVFLAVVLVTYGYQDVPAWWALPVLGIAPLGLLAAGLGNRAWIRALLAIGAPLAIATAGTVAVVASVPDDDGGGYYDEY